MTTRITVTPITHNEREARAFDAIARDAEKAGTTDRVHGMPPRRADHGLLQALGDSLGLQLARLAFELQQQDQPDRAGCLRAAAVRARELELDVAEAIRVANALHVRRHFDPDHPIVSECVQRLQRLEAVHSSKPSGTAQLAMAVAFDERATSTVGDEVELDAYGPDLPTQLAGIAARLAAATTDNLPDLACVAGALRAAAVGAAAAAASPWSRPGGGVHRAMFDQVARDADRRRHELQRFAQALDLALGLRGKLDADDPGGLLEAFRRLEAQAIAARALLAAAYRVEHFRADEPEPDDDDDEAREAASIAQDLRQAILGAFAAGVRP